MRLWVGGRQTGKTTKLVEWLLNSEEHFILTAYRPSIQGVLEGVIDRRFTALTDDAKRRLRDEAMLRVYGLAEVRHARPSARTQKWSVDDIDSILQQLVAGNVVQGTHGTDLQVENV